ncbi:MAG: N-acetyltransferase [Bacilli bacterium]|nr:N-acetyltransferase [Bacilli bacterium]
MITIQEVNLKNKRELRKFVRFPHKIYRNVTQYVPSLDNDEMAMFIEEKNGALEWCATRCWMAYIDNEEVGRVGAIFNRKYNEKVNKIQMRITRFDFIDNKEVSKRLIDEVLKWARELNCTEIIGPIGFSDLDKEGMLIEGFDRDSLNFCIYNHPYYVAHMNELGFEKLNDWVEYRIKLPEAIDPRLEKIAEKSKEKFGYRVKYFKNKKEVIPYLRKGFKIMNQVYSHLLGYTELSERQMDEFVSNFGVVLNSEFLFAIEDKNDNLIGYGFFAPNVNKGMRKCMGRFTIPGIIRLMKDLLIIKEKHPNDTVDLYSIGVLPEYQSMGVNAVVMVEGFKACIKRKIKYAETGPELEYNHQIQSQWKDYEKEQHKKRRCWIKMI